MNGGVALGLRWVREVLDHAPRIGRDRSDRELRSFLRGSSDGGKLLHAIFDEVLDEPVPTRLSAVLKNPTTSK